MSRGTDNIVAQSSQTNINNDEETEVIDQQSIMCSSPDKSMAEMLAQDNIPDPSRQSTISLDDNEETIRSLSTLDDAVSFAAEAKEFRHSKLKGIILYSALNIFILFLIFLSCMYGFGQLYSISLSNFWCDKKYESYTIDDIYQINRENGLAEGSQYTCLATDAIVDYDKLFAIDPSIAYESSFDEDNTSRNYVLFAFYQLIALSLLFVIVSPLRSLCSLCKCDRDVFSIPVEICDCNKNGICACICKQRMENSDNVNDNDGDSSRNNYNSTLFVIVFRWRRKIKKLLKIWHELTSVDTTWWIGIKLGTETLEIWAQILVLFEYGGTSLTEIIFDDSNNDSQLAQLPHYVIIFATIILINGIITGTFWILYSLFPSKIYGHSYNDMLFICDGIFDSIYSIYPFIIAGAFTNDSNINTLINKIGILQHNTLGAFMGAGFPMLLLVKKCYAAMKRVKNILKGRHIGDEYSTYTSDLELYSLHSRTQSVTMVSTQCNSNGTTTPVNEPGDDTTTHTSETSGTFSNSSRTHGHVSTDSIDIHRDPTLDLQLSHGRKATVRTHKGKVINKKFYISHRNLLQKQVSRQFVATTTNQSVIKRHHNRRFRNTLKRILLSMISLLFVTGISTLAGLSATINTLNAQSYCNSFTIDDSVMDNSELLLYKTNCRTKVYKLFVKYPCDCRFFQITTQETSDSNSALCKIANSGVVNEGDMINQVFGKWKMLERVDIRSNGVGSACFGSYTINVTDHLFFGGKYLQALVLQYAQFAFLINIDDVAIFEHVSWNITYNEYDQVIINETGKFIMDSMKNWQNIIFLDFINVDMGHYDYFFSLGIGQYMQNIIYLSIEPLAITQWPQTWCNMYKNLKYFEISSHSIKSVDDCLGKFEQLQYFKFFRGLTTYIPFGSLFNLPKISIIALNWQDFTWDTIIDAFYLYRNTTFDYQFVGFNENTLREVYFQANPLCNSFFDRNNNNGDNNYSEIMTMVNNFSACTTSCRNSDLEYVCPSFKIHNGICDTLCNRGNCAYDGGDCNQLCTNYTHCFKQSSLNEEGCNPICNSAECGWDGNECIEDSLECPNLCPHSVLNDGLCHKKCLNKSYTDCYEYELYHDCSTCADNCQKITNIFELICSLTPDDDDKEAISWADCQKIETGAPHAWDLLNDANVTCDYIFLDKDYNNNTLIGLWEFIQIGNGLLQKDEIGQAQYVDCSMCLNNASNYYV